MSKFKNRIYHNIIEELDELVRDISRIDNQIDDLEYEKEGLEDRRTVLKKELAQIRDTYNNIKDITYRYNFDDFYKLFVEVKNYCESYSIPRQLFIPLGNFNVSDMYCNQELFLKFVNYLDEYE